MALHSVAPNSSAFTFTQAKNADQRTEHTEKAWELKVNMKARAFNRNAFLDE